MTICACTDCFDRKHGKSTDELGSLPSQSGKKDEGELGGESVKESVLVFTQQMVVSIHKSKNSKKKKTFPTTEAKMKRGQVGKTGKKKQ